MHTDHKKHNRHNRQKKNRRHHQKGTAPANGFNESRSDKRKNHAAHAASHKGKANGKGAFFMKPVVENDRKRHPRKERRAHGSNGCKQIKHPELRRTRIKEIGNHNKD